MCLNALLSTLLTALLVTAHVHITVVTLVLLENPFSPQFSQLINSQKRLGSDKFPLIDQTFYPNYRDMVRDLVLCFTSYIHIYVLF